MLTFPDFEHEAADGPEGGLFKHPSTINWQLMIEFSFVTKTFKLHSRDGWETWQEKQAKIALLPSYADKVSKEPIITPHR